MAKHPELYVCTNLRVSGTSCAGQGAHAVLRALRTAAGGGDGAVRVRESVCLGYCGQGPNVKVRGGGFHHGVAPGDAAALLAEALEAAKDISTE